MVFPYCGTEQPLQIATDSFLGCDHAQPLWYAAYTRSRHEKLIAQQLEGRRLEHFLPLYSSMRRWKDRRVLLHLPLFPGYVFVRLAATDRMQVLTVPGVVTLVGVNGRPCPVADAEIEGLRSCLYRQFKVVPHPYLAVGRRVRVKNGALADMEGILIRRKSQFRLVLSINLIQRSVMVEMDCMDVVPA